MNQVYNEINQKIVELHDFVYDHPDATNISLQIALVYINENDEKIKSSRVQLVKCNHPNEMQFLAKSAEQATKMAQKFIQLIHDRTGDDNHDD